MKRTLQTHSRIHRAILETLETRRLFNFGPAASYPAGSQPYAIATGDFNGDGRSDAVASLIGGSSVSVRLSNADGTLQSAQTFATGAGTRAIALGDVNNDGKRDIVTANNWNLSVLLGNGNGTFQPALSTVLPTQFPPGYTGSAPLEQTPISVAVGDLNADGKLDLAVGAVASWKVLYNGYYGQYYRYYSQPYVNVLLGNGNGAFSNAPAAPFNANSIGIGDFNSDTKLDVLAGSYGDVMLGNGDGTLQPPIHSVNVAARDWAIADFDGDGTLDLAGGIDRPYVLKGQGNGTFQTPVIAADVPLRSSVAGDVNADGKLDLILSTQVTTFAYYGYYGAYDPTTTDYTKVLLGHGDGTFARAITMTLGSHDDFGAPNLSELGDFNGDGRPDLLSTDPINSSLIVQLNQSNWIVPGTLRIGDATVIEGHVGTVNAIFTVTLAEAPAANVTVNYATVDDTATAASGDYVATTGTLTFLPGQTTKTISVLVKGDRIGEAGDTFHVNLTNGVNGDILDAIGDGLIIDDEPRVSINSNASLTETNSGTSPMTFTVTLSAASDVESTVNFNTSSGSAVSGKDFDATAGMVTFLAGEISKTFTVPVRGDLIDEYEEYFQVSLANAGNAFIVNGTRSGGIIDNDALPSMVIGDISRAEGNSGTTLFRFTISLLTGSEKAVYALCSTSNGTATSSTSGGKQDYQPVLGQLYINPGEQSTVVTVLVKGDTRNESDETFFLNLSNAAEATIGDSQGIATILNDDGGRGKVWVGPASGGSWSTAASWSPSGAPISTSLVTISSASVNLTASAAVSEVSLTNGATLTLAANGNRVLSTPGLYVDYPSTLNLNDNSLVVDYTGVSPLPAVQTLINDARAGGAWNGAGITSLAAANANPKNTTLAALEASEFKSIYGAGATFDGQAIDNTAILVKYTYYGDADFNGQVNFDDYGRIDNGFSTGKTGWLNGDVDGNGAVNFDDYALIDLAFNTQGPAL